MVSVSMPGPKPQKKKAMLPPSAVLQDNFDSRENLEDTWDVSTTRRRIPGVDDDTPRIADTSADTSGDVAEEDSLVAQLQNELNASRAQQQPLLNRPAEKMILRSPGVENPANRFSQDTLAAIELYFKKNVTPPTVVDVDVEQQTPSRSHHPNSQAEKSGCQCNCTVNIVLLFLILVPISGGGFYLATRKNCEPGWIYSAETNWCYKVVEPSTFVEAATFCRRMGAHLTSIHSCRENRKVAYLVRLGINSKRSNRREKEEFGLMWIGLSTDSYNVWNWSDGTTYDFKNWHDNERRNGTSYRQCAAVYVDYHGKTDCRKTDWFCEYYLYKWTAVPCSLNKRPSVCRKPPINLSFSYQNIAE